MLDNENTVKAEGLQKVTRRAHSHESNVGTVTSIRGSVIDVKFLDHLPSLNRLLKTGENDGVVIEVMNHLDSKTVRGIALTTTPGLAHGAAVIDTRLPPKVPVGRRLLGRISLQFGAAPYFGIVNIRRKDKEIEKQDIIENPHRSVETAKGIRVAEWLVDQGVEHVGMKEDVSHKGPGYVLSNGGVKIHIISAGQIGQAICEIIAEGI